MIWNVWWRFGDDWRAREKSILTTLESYRPDVLGLVESWSGDGTDQPQRLASHAGGLHSAWIPAAASPLDDHDHPGVDSGLGLVSRWPIRSVETEELPHAQRGGPQPYALVATLDHPRGPLHVIVAGTEWEQRYADDHLAQTRFLAALATDARFDGPLPVLLLADLNASVDQPETAPLLDAMVDAWDAARADPGAVTLDGRLPIAPRDAFKQLDRRIDHVFARAGRPGAPLAVRGAFLAGDRPIETVYPSDHYAVGVDLEP
jgi:endonuclease/exonuclease/phosphatase family metal-dependent hydrolase